MIILLHSSKSMKGSPSKANQYQAPLLLEKAKTIDTYLKTLRPKQLQKAMKISASLSLKTHELISHWNNDPSNQTPAIDAFRGDPFFTPLLIGSVVFLGQSPTVVAETRLDMMALLTMVHLASFFVLGTASTLFYQSLGQRMRHPAILGAVIFVVMGTGLFVLDSFMYPGIVSAIGLIWIGVANAIAAGIMAWFIHVTLDQA